MCPAAGITRINEIDFESLNNFNGGLYCNPFFNLHKVHKRIVVICSRKSLLAKVLVHGILFKNRTKKK